MIRLLLEKNADPNAKTGDGETVLMWARKFSPESVIEMLKQAGAKDPSRNDAF